MSAVIALGGGMRFRVDIQGVVRAGLHAGFAADTTLVIKIHDAIVADE